MGAADFTSFSSNPDFQAAFSERRAQEGYESGHCYSGEMGSMSTAQRYPGITQPLPKGAAQLLANRELERWDESPERVEPQVRLEKGWNAVGIPVGPDDAFKFRPKTVTFTVDGSETYFTPEKLAALADLQLGAGEKLVSAEIVSRTERFTVEAAATVGKATTRYFITNASGAVLPDHDPQGFSSQAAARAAATKMVRDSASGSWPLYTELGVVGRKVRESGEPLVRIGRSNLKTRLKVRFRTAKPKSSYVPCAGWLFFGIAPC